MTCLSSFKGYIRLLFYIGEPTNLKMVQVLVFGIDKYILLEFRFH